MSTHSLVLFSICSVSTLDAAVPGALPVFLNPSQAATLLDAKADNTSQHCQLLDTNERYNLWGFSSGLSTICGRNKEYAQLKCGTNYAYPQSIHKPPKKSRPSDEILFPGSLEGKLSVPRTGH